MNLRVVILVLLIFGLILGGLLGTNLYVLGGNRPSPSFIVPGDVRYVTVEKNGVSHILNFQQQTRLFCLLNSSRDRPDPPSELFDEQPVHLVLHRFYSPDWLIAAAGRDAGGNLVLSLKRGDQVRYIKVKSERAFETIVEEGVSDGEK